MTNEEKLRFCELAIEAVGAETEAQEKRITSEADELITDQSLSVVWIFLLRQIGQAVEAGEDVFVDQVKEWLDSYLHRFSRFSQYPTKFRF